jgi:hypothetical protein
MEVSALISLAQQCAFISVELMPKMRWAFEGKEKKKRDKN